MPKPKSKKRKTTVCLFCRDGEYSLFEEHCKVIYRGYACTRKAGHKGDHQACGNIDHQILGWEQGAEYADGRDY